MDLRRFGFTPTEAKVYQALLAISPATGYAVAQAARLARANVYDALDGLAARGAATRLPGKPARYAALDPETLVGKLRRDASEGLDAMLRDLSRVQRAATAPVSPMESFADREQLLGRAAECVRSTRSELLAVVGPWAQELFGVLVEVRHGGRILSLGSPAPEGALIRAVPEHEIETYWGGLPIALLADRRRAVCGIVQQDGGASGIATEHPGIVPFLRHLLRRELASASPRGVS